MPKYQEIGGEIYVEGGPACDYFGGMDRCEGGKLASNSKDWEPDWVGDDCKICHGTGVKPLSKWTADMCTEWLARAGFEFSEIDCLNATKEFTEWGITGFITSGQIGACEKGFTNTLRVLVAAVAKRKDDA